MPDTRLPKKVFYEELEEIALKVAQRNARTSLKDFEIQMGSWEQIAQARSHQRRSSCWHLMCVFIVLVKLR